MISWTSHGKRRTKGDGPKVVLLRETEVGSRKTKIHSPTNGDVQTSARPKRRWLIMDGPYVERMNCLCFAGEKRTS